MPIVEARNLSHVFADGTAAIEDVNLQIEPKEFVVIAGPNGSGKTVFIRHLNGLLAPTRGQVLINGESIAKNLLQTRKKVGMVFQDSDSQIVGQTVEEDVAFGPENLNLPPEEVEKLVSESLQAVGLESYAAQNPHTLSGGLKKKLAIAGILAMKPEVIIFDEPFAGLDYPGTVQVLKQIVALHASGHTILLVTHELEKVLAHANRLMIISQGKLVKNGAPSEVIGSCESYGIRMPLRENEGIETLTWLK